jgi:eukaryotic-like serine/threonine-protein kinase
VARDDQHTAESGPSGGEAPTTVADPPLIASGRRLGERYRLRHPLGHGGMASVWLADDERLRRPVAIKVISEALAHDDEYAGRFRREAKVAARLQHPNLVAIYDFDAGPRPYLVMEYIDGGDLAGRLAAGEAPDPERLGRELLAALRHIHGAGVVHRDIKPQNVLLDADGRARLTDFGIAQPRDATALTKTGHVIGTERYLAPEVQRGDEATERSDLYALGVLLSEVAPEGAGAGFWALAERLRDPEPEARPRSAAAALALMERDDETLPLGEATRPLAVAPEPEPRFEAVPTPRRPATESPLSRAFEPPERTRASRMKALGALAVALTAVAVVVGLALGAGGGEEGSAGAGEPQATNDEPANDRAQGGGGGADQAAEPATDSAETATPQQDAVAETGGGPVDGVALNDDGFALIGQGRYDEAIPILERARNVLAESGDETTYNYATYNLATAYLGAGRPEDAIPLLQERMQFDDGQLGEVRATLEEAYAAAGQTSSGGVEGDDGQSGSGKKESRGVDGSESKGGGPPPWANND